jgi:hypothetical protein
MITKERGQAHLPNPETPGGNIVLGLKAILSEDKAQVYQSQGWEGGLAPALFPSEFTSSPTAVQGESAYAVLS